MQINSEYYKKVLDTLYDGIYFIDQDKKIICGIKEPRSIQDTNNLR
jgi:hypothetical protein